MAGKDFDSLFPYPLRGLGILAIFICVSPAVQAVIFKLFDHHWVGGSQLLIEISDVLFKQAFPAVLGGYTIYMPAAFISGALCALTTARGTGLTLNSTIFRSVIGVFCVELLLAIVTFIYVPSASEIILTKLLAAVVAAVFAGWICWVIATGFRLDKSAQENEEARK